MKKSTPQILLYTIFYFLTPSGWAEPIEAETTAISLPYPPMAGSLVTDSNPLEMKAGPLDKIYITGTLSGLGLWQDNPIAGNPSTLLDLDNGQLFIQNTKGLLQFYVQAGVYSLPSLGTSYLRMDETTRDFYGPVPVAFIKLCN